MKTKEELLIITNSIIDKLNIELNKELKKPFWKNKNVDSIISIGEVLTFNNCRKRSIIRIKEDDISVVLIYSPKADWCGISYPKSISINVSKIYNELDLKGTIIHELTHVFGGIEYINEYNYPNHMSDKEYFCHPFEMEAWKSEGWLYSIEKGIMFKDALKELLEKNADDEIVDEILNFYLDNDK